LIGKTVIASARSLVEPYRSESPQGRSFFCVSKASLDGKVYDGLYDGFWLIDGSKGTTAFFVIEDVLERTPSWVTEKYPRVAYLAR
jgi:hypothetical protein